jgi:type I restriction enzyme, S subunit
VKYKPYPKYKDSGVEWLGKIPEGWRNVQLKWLTTRYSGGTPDKNNPDYWENGTIPWIASGEVNQWEITQPTTYITDLGFENSSAKWIPSGAIIMALAGQGKTKGMVAFVRLPVTGNQSLVAIVPCERIISAYLLFWLHSQYTRIRSQASDDLRDGLNLEIIGSIPCPLPSLPTQHIIATFLDTETAKIDRLIKEYEDLIALLGEKRQALISHAVTRGLSELVKPDDPEFGEWAKPVKFVDSGVEWLGEIPEGWDIGPLKRWISVVDCKHLTAEFVEDGYPLVSIREVQSDLVDISDAQQTTKYFFETLCDGGRELKDDDLVFCRNVAVGQVAIVPPLPVPVAMGQDVCRLRPYKPEYSSKYLLWVLKSTFIVSQLDVAMIGATFKRINVEQIRDLSICNPPPSTQQAIASFLDRETAKLDSQVSETRSAIELLKEHRSALITAAVTGKINVEK